MNNPFDFLINNLNSDFLLSWSTICQIAIIFLAVGLASISNNSIRNYFISKTKESKEILVNGASRIISPIVTLIVLCISNSALNQYQPTNILSIAITLVNAMILIRLSIYLIRYIIKPSDSIKALESLISITVWVLVALHLFGVLYLNPSPFLGQLFLFLSCTNRPFWFGNTIGLEALFLFLDAFFRGCKNTHILLPFDVSLGHHLAG